VKNIRSILAGTLAVFLWAAIPALVKTGTTQDNLSFLLVMRFLISSLIFLPFLKKVCSKLFQIPKKQLAILAVILGANYYFQGLAMHLVPASWYVVIFSLNPIIAILLLKIPLTSRKWIGFSLAFIGTLLFTIGQMESAPWLALIYITIGMLTWVLYTQTIQKFQTVFNDIESSAVTQFFSLIACAMIWFGHGLPTEELGAAQWTSLAVLGLTTPLAYYCFSFCLRKTPAFGVISQYLEPVFGVLIGVLFFHETLAWPQILGASAIVFGSLQVEK
jgi:drug/metabolite transporter (DMT)-like permease